MVMRDLIMPPETQDFATLVDKLSVDIQTLAAIRKTRYLRPRTHVAKAGNLHLAWVYAGNPNDHGRFVNMLRVSPYVFEVILDLIKDHDVFTNNSNVPQTPVDQQLAVALYRLGRYGNAASLEDIARVAGCSEEVEKVWMDKHLGFKGLWREGWLMYDGTIVVLYAKPGMNGQGYYTRKANYGLNVQIGNIPSTLRIADYSLGYTGSAHDSAAFEGTAAFKHPDWLFQGDEFAWGDSAYTLSSRVIPVHKRPASLIPDNATFDRAVSHIRVRSEHCMGALKGRFQCLRGLRVNINSNEDHWEALRWVTVAIILHNLVIYVEGEVSAAHFAPAHTRHDEEEDRGDRDEPGGEDANGEAKRRRLTQELLAHRAQRNNNQ
ncbi:DDE Tnp4 domain-containing protein [Mycena sanguinolenta]|uniref:DDE Tnp4 domain-containing protein n=1 Tax=Mycena sanguinolenta TaxID=230812 RepID=A0A8H7DKA3_9AGAR|nr:DDE Tnp4 domain-containing protein [Mycena sanguinolenta]